MSDPDTGTPFQQKLIAAAKEQLSGLAKATAAQLKTLLNSEDISTKIQSLKEAAEKEGKALARGCVDFDGESLEILMSAISTLGNIQKVLNDLEADPLNAEIYLAFETAGQDVSRYKAPFYRRSIGGGPKSLNERRTISIMESGSDNKKVVVLGTFEPESTAV